MKANRFELRIRIRIRGCKDENSAFASESAELEICIRMHIRIRGCGKIRIRPTPRIYKI